ncbi:MAG: hypothetical protein C0171_04420 [Caldisphaera sp.]|nr:MAG: hypothetical protein C0171_04420 [Caldisphaera sp.]
MKDIIAELTPYSNKEKLLRYAKDLIEYSDIIDIPDAPLGMPSPSSSIISCLVKDKFDSANIITNLRLLDINRLNLINTITALKMNQINNFLLVRGDLPQVGNKIDDITPDEAIDVIRSKYIDTNLGLLLNLNKPIREINDRIERRASFYLITRPWFSEKLEDVSKKVKGQRSKLYLYFVLITEKNREFLLKHLPIEELIQIEKLEEAIQKVESYVDGILFSSPMDHEGLIKSLKISHKFI